MSMLLFVESMLSSIISESDFVVSSVVRSAQALFSFHMPTGKLGSRPIGEDVGSPVDFTYKPPFKFTGTIDKVTIELK
jgi:hypothetical protein